MNRKNHSFAIAMLAIACSFSFSAMAGNHNPPKPPANNGNHPEATGGTGIGVGLGLGIAGSVSNSGAAADSGSYSANNVDLTQQGNKALGISFAPGAYTVVPQAYGCIATNSQAVNVIFGAFSGSKSEQKSDKVCVAVKMREIAFEQCQYATAKAWDNLIVKELFPDAPAFPVNASYKDLPLSECTY